MLRAPVVRKPSPSAIRATLRGLHVAALLAGAEGVLAFAVFHFAPAGVVGGVALALASVLAMLAYPWPAERRSALGDLRIWSWGVALSAIGAVLIRVSVRA